MKEEYITNTPEEFGRQLSKQHWRTLYYLASNGYITPETYYELIETTFVTSVKNDSSLAERFLARLFKQSDSSNCYSFPIVNIKDDTKDTNNTDGSTKPNLRLVKDKG